jgi:Xaa-Pro aminopeptidase
MESIVGHAQPSRLGVLQGRLDQWQLDGLLISDETNVGYLSGFGGDSSLLLVMADRTVILTDRRYEEQLATECPALESRIRGPAKTTWALAAETAAEYSLSRVGFEQEHTSYGAAQRLLGHSPSTKWVGTSGIVERMRICKDAGEIAAICAAVATAERAYMALRRALVPTMTELEAAWLVEEYIRREGGDGASFPIIIAANAHASLPHARPRRVPIGGQGLLLVDWGARQAGYISDLTRVIPLDEPSATLRERHRIVAQAQQAAFETVRPGVARREVDGAGRKVIADAGFGECFGHALGHGIGRQVHEAPRLAADQTETLEAGMVITLEPAIYLPQWGGIRLEDDVLVTPDGAKRLSQLPLGLEENAPLR